MIIVNTHEAKSKLSYLLREIEEHQEIVRICRNNKPIADIVPISKQKNPLQQYPGIREVEVSYDPTEPLSEDEWPEDAK